MTMPSLVVEVSANLRGALAWFDFVRSIRSSDAAAVWTASTRTTIATTALLMPEPSVTGGNCQDTLEPMKPWRTILVPHDFSASADHAALLAIDEAKTYAGRIILLHVVVLPPHFGPETTLMVTPESETPIGVRAYAVRLATKELAAKAEALAARGVEVTPVVRVGHPVDEILAVVAERNVDVIVMGTHGRTGVEHLLVGSVTERIVRTSAVPVLTTRHPD
jgi:nucleotide-binding universal stress UspA family protein